MIAAFDGDGKADIAVYRPSNGAFVASTFGNAEDIPTPNAFVK